jgi:hypothetical protein
MLRMWGVLDADIEGIDGQADCQPPVTDLDTTLLAAAEVELRQLFRNTDPSSPAIAELFRLCLLRKVRNESR